MAEVVGQNAETVWVIAKWYIVCFTKGCIACVEDVEHIAIWDLLLVSYRSASDTQLWMDWLVYVLRNNPNKFVIGQFESLEANFGVRRCVVDFNTETVGIPGENVSYHGECVQF